MRLAFVTQTLDAEHPVLAQTLDLVGALAERVDELVVITRDVRSPLPANATARTFDARTQLGRGLAFERAFAPVRADAILVHMVPTFLNLAAPLAKARRTPLLLWYTHWHAGRALRVATALCDMALSVDRRSFPLPSPKVHGIGHAIDVDTFSEQPPIACDGPLRLVSVGRFARSKGLTTLLEALRIAVVGGADLELELRGPELSADERAHRAELGAIVDRTPELRGRVRFEPGVPRAEVPQLLAAADAFVSASEPERGAFLDKAVYEAAACARVVVSTNPLLDEFLGDLPLRLRASARDPGALAATLTDLAAAPASLLTETGRELRRRVVAGHSLDHWADAVIELARR